MAYGDYDGPDKPDKGKEGGSCNRGRCQASPALWYNHGSYHWYCDECKRDIWDANKFTYHLDMPNAKQPMFETREMMTARQQQTVDRLTREENLDRPIATREEIGDFIAGLLGGVRK